MSRYLTAGLVNIDNIYSCSKQMEASSKLGGGAMFALSALRLWTDDPLLVSYVGQDFDEFFGDWMNANGCSTEGVCRVVDKTPRSHLEYQDNGTYIPRIKPSWYSGARMTPNIQLLQRHLNNDLAGVHIVSHSDAVFFEQLDHYRKLYGFRVGFEIGNAFDDPHVSEMIKEVTDNYVDFFSLSFTEAKEYYPGIRDVQDGVDMCLSLKCPVYFRLGEDGAYMTMNGNAYRFSMIDEFKTVDPTGCGNASTAAAFWALSENKSVEEAGIIAAVTASLNASYSGIIPVIQPWMRRRLQEYVSSRINSDMR